MSLDLIAPADLNTLALLALAEVETFPSDSMSSSSALISGTIYGALAICRTAGTYSKIGFVHAGNTPSLTELRAGIHDPTVTNWTRITDTGDIKASLSVGTINTVIEAALGAPVTLARGQAIGLSLGGSGATMPSVSSAAVRFALQDRATKAGPKRARTATGYTTGVLPTLDTSPAGNFIPYVYLAP